VSSKLLSFAEAAFRVIVTCVRDSLLVPRGAPPSRCGTLAAI